MSLMSGVSYASEIGALLSVMIGSYGLEHAVGVVPRKLH